MTAVPAARPASGERTSCLILSCSPRAGGNSDTAARLFCRAFARGREESGFAGADGTAPEPGPATLFLRDYAVSPCTACDACGRAAPGFKPRPGTSPLRELFGETPFPCPAAARDDSLPLLRALAETEELCLVSPVYFYHLPAQLKALLDRMQLFRSMNGSGFRPHHGPERLCRIILIGGRTRGAQLFAGSLLSLKYALATMRVATAEPLLLYGLDAGDALRGSPAAAERIEEYGLAAGRVAPRGGA
jgi:multimeric flavodoxin WrbA